MFDTCNLRHGLEIDVKRYCMRAINELPEYTVSRNQLRKF